MTSDRVRAAILVAVAIVALGSCGGSLSTAARVRDAFVRYEAAVAAGDAAAACGYLSASVISRLLSAAAAAGISSGSCASIFGRELAAADPASRVRQRSLAATTSVEVLWVRGMQARVALRSPLGSLTETANAAAVLEGGRWKISELPGREMVGRYLAFRVPSSSMSPTLTPDSFILVDPGAYAGRSPAIGDIVVFHPPADHAMGCALPSEGPSPGGAPAQRACGVPGRAGSQETFIKRIVAGPGDTVAFINGRVLRNGVAAPDSFPVSCTMGFGCDFPTPVKVPTATWFVVGDNRAQSEDSREFGPIRITWIIGKLARIVR